MIPDTSPPCPQPCDCPILRGRYGGRDVLIPSCAAITDAEHDRMVAAMAEVLPTRPTPGRQKVGMYGTFAEARDAFCRAGRLVGAGDRAELFFACYDAAAAAEYRFPA